MPDLLQPGPILSLPLLHSAAEQLDADLSRWAEDRPLALLLPCHVRDLDGAALDGIIAVLADVPWVSRVVVGLDGADESQHAEAVEKFRPLGGRVTVLHRREAAGKGANLSKCAAHALRDPGIFAVAMHDCDIACYGREFLARLCWPVLHAGAGLAACKGCYARSAGGLHGRVFRLLFQPLLRAWAELCPSPWTQFLQSLRYPLAGELCVRAELLRRLDWDAGWGVEVRLLHELYRQAGPERLCQSELCTAYDHKHQAPSGLVVMGAEVARALRITMRAEGCAANEAALSEAYLRHMARALRDSQLTAAVNGFARDAAEEGELAQQFLAAAFEEPPHGQA
jgi:glucosyl-3-phosphoglycerate synthase